MDVWHPRANVTFPMPALPLETDKIPNFIIPLHGGQFLGKKSTGLSLGFYLNCCDMATPTLIFEMLTLTTNCFEESAWN